MHGGGLKPLARITEPEPRSTRLHHFPPTGEPVPLTLELFHQLVDSLALVPSSHSLVRDHFDAARNTLLYSWFENSLTRVAELQSFASLELGLRLRLLGASGLFKRSTGLGNLLHEAIDAGLVKDDPIGPYPIVSAFGQAWSTEPDPADPEVASRITILCKAIPTVRNRLAHGHPGWAGTAFASLSACRDLLNPLATEAPAAA